jgi:hypothetical protein
MKLSLALLALAAMATSASAAKLVTLAMNSGIDTSSPYVNNLPPNLPPGTKGFLIGIDIEDNQVGVPLGVQNIQFNNVVHQQGQLDELGDAYPTPLNMTTRSSAQLQELNDAALNAPATNAYRRSDTYVMDNVQPGIVGVWTAVGPGFEGGDPGDTFFRITGSLGLPSAVTGPGVVQLAYVIAAGDVPISANGVIARGNVGFDPGGNAPGSAPGYLLDFETGEIRPIPEPSTVVLAGLAMVGLAVGAWRRK